MTTRTWTRGGEQTSHVSVKWTLTFLLLFFLKVEVFHELWRNNALAFPWSSHGSNGHFTTYSTSEFIFLFYERERERTHFLMRSKGCELVKATNNNVLRHLGYRQLGISIRMDKKSSFDMLKKRTIRAKIFVVSGIGGCTTTSGWFK